MKTSTILKNASRALFIMLLLVIGTSSTYSQPDCDAWLPKYKDNPYPHPYGGNQIKVYFGMDWGIENIYGQGNYMFCEYEKYGWGYWYNWYTFYPYTRIDYIAFHEKGNPKPVWQWSYNNCESWFTSYIYITGPAGEGGWGGLPGAQADPNVAGSKPGETWKPVELKLGKTYTMKFVSQDDWQANAYTYFYWDKDNDKTFDQKGEIVGSWLGDYSTNYAYCDYTVQDYDGVGYNYYCAGSMINEHPGISCYRGYYDDEPDYNYYYIYRNYYHYWKEYQIDIEIPADGVVVGKPNRMRLKRLYAYDFPRPDQLYYEYNSGSFMYSYDYYGQIIDFDIIFGGLEVKPFPNEGTLTFANEKYNDQTRVPKIYQPNGATVKFTKPEVEFSSPPSDILEMEYRIIGPRPSQSVVYRATNSLGGTRIKVDKNTLTQRTVTIPDPNNPNGTINVQRYYWKAGFTGQYDASTNGQYVKDENGNLLTDGSFFTAQSGEYSVILNFFENNKPVEGAKELFYNFTIKTSYDVAAMKILDPKPVNDPWYETHILRSQKQVVADIKNIGLNPVNDFKVRYTIKGIDANTKGIKQTSEFTYDDQNYGTLKVDDIFTVRFSKLFEGQVVGDYSVVVEVYDLDGEGPADKDQSHFNDYYPRPLGGSQEDGWQVSEEYVIRFVYQHDLAVKEILFPKEEPATDVEKVYVNRPFRPVVRYANYGQQDLAQEVYASIVITRESDGSIVSTIEDYVVELVPAGLRFNTRDVKFPDVTITEAGRYKIEARIGSIFEDPAATLIGNNMLVGYFDVEEGMQGIFTVGTMNSGKPKNFETIDDAMKALYTYGVNGNITFELTDAKYSLIGHPAWDFTTAIVGLGFNKEINKTFTMTWKAAQNRAMIKGGVEIELNSDFGYGVKFGQGLSYNKVENAAVNQSEDPDYINSKGYITFDGGALKSLKFVMKSNDKFAAPFYLGGGSQNITLKNLIITNANESISKNSVRLPIIKGATTVGNIVEYTNDRQVDSRSRVFSYSAGIVNRGQLFNFQDPTVTLPAKYDIEDLDTMSNKNIVIEGNEISGFGYGIVSLGMGGLYDVQKGRYVNYNGTDLQVNNNVISNVGRAGIAIGNEEKVSVKGNRISNVNPDNISVDTRYRADNSAVNMTYDHSGIMIGGLIYQTEDRNNVAVTMKGLNAKDVLVDGNRVYGVKSNYNATGIKVEQNPVYYDANLPTKSILMPEKESNVRVVNNIIKDINGTSSTANRGGIHLFTQRENGNMLMPAADQPSFRTLNDKIANNTILLGSSPNVVTNNGLIIGIAIQQANNTDVSNNIVVIDDATISGNAEVTSAVYVQGLYSKDGGPTLDFNSYYVAPNTGAQLVRFIEMNSKNNEPKYNDWYLYKHEFENLEQWRIVSGSDKNSIEYNAMNDLDLSNGDVAIKLTNGLTPIGSPLNNRGKKSNWYNTDINGNERGLTGQRYDIGAIEFKGRQYTNDLQSMRITAPAAYRASVVDPVTGVDFTDAEYIMTEGSIPVKVQIRNDGSMQQSEVKLTMRIERQDNMGSWVKEYEVVKTATIPSSNEGEVDFDMADGIGEDFKPKTYGDYNNDTNQTNNYAADARFVGMEANVTPVYRITVETEADENNANNITTKDVRFYLRKTDRYIILSTTDNQGSFNGYMQGGNTPAEMDRYAGSMNTQVLRTALLGFNWAVNPNQGKYDYDMFDRNGWEKRSVNYTMYQTLVWSDGFAENDGLNRFSTNDVRNYLASGLDIFKKNLIIASEDMVNNSEQTDFIREVLRAENEGQVTSTAYNMTADPQITGDGIAKGRSFLVSDASLQYLGTDDSDYYPYPSSLKPVNGTDLSGTSVVGATYDSRDDAFRTNGAAIATVTVTYNALYLGMDWRHIGNLSMLMAGVLDFIKENDAPIVPVEISEFNANQQGSKVALDWTTASEVNSSKFEIEKKETGSNIFRSIEEVKAAGNSTTSQVYGPYYDYNVKYGNSYTYRLKMIDKDGTSSHSQERVVSLKGEAGTLTVVSVGPNPSKDKSELRLNLGSTMPLTIELYDMAGNQVKTIYTGSQVSGESRYEINVNGLSSGIYNIVVRSGEIQIIEPLSVVR